MMISRKTTHRKIAIAFLALICMMQVSVPIYHAQALFIPVIDPAHITATEKGADQTVAAIEAAALSQIEADEIAAKFLAIKQAAEKAIELEERLARDAVSYFERFVLGPAVRIALVTLIQSLADEAVGWISGDGGRNGGFIKNLQQNAFTEANLQAGEFLNHVSGIDLCSVDISKIIKLTINVPGYEHLNAQLGCTLTGIVDNVDKFYQDFNNGGWPAFVGIAVDSQNNAIGASMIAEVNFAAKKGSAARALQDRLNRGSGFKGVTLKKKSLVCDTVKDRGRGDVIGNDAGDPVRGDVIGNDAGDQICYMQDVDNTPGGVVADALNKNLNHVGIDMGIASIAAVRNEVDAAINAIITTLVQRLFKEATNLF